MSTPSDPSRSQQPPVGSGADGTAMSQTGPLPTPNASPGQRHRPWGWIAACVVLLLVAGGFAIWAVGLQSDLDDQRDQTAQAQQEAEQANEAVGALSAQVDDISQGLDDASDQIAQAGDDAQQGAEDALDGAKNKLATLKDQLAQAGEAAGNAEATPTP